MYLSQTCFHLPAINLSVNWQNFLASNRNPSRLKILKNFSKLNIITQQFYPPIIIVVDRSTRHFSFQQRETCGSRTQPTHLDGNACINQSAIAEWRLVPRDALHPWFQGVAELFMAEGRSGRNPKPLRRSTLIETYVQLGPSSQRPCRQTVKLNLNASEPTPRHWLDTPSFAATSSWIIKRVQERNRGRGIERCDS